MYTLMVKLARKHSPNALTALDVGAYESPLLSRLDWIPTKVATDIQARPQVWNHIQGIAFVQSDFMKLQLGTRFDLVICNQVVEHLPDSLVGAFVRKLASHTQETLIITTTHELEAGAIKGHVQDPISEAEFRSWFAGIKERGTLEISFIHNNFKRYRPKGNIIGIWKRAGGS